MHFNSFLWRLPNFRMVKFALADNDLLVSGPSKYWLHATSSCSKNQIWFSTIIMVENFENHNDLCKILSFPMLKNWYLAEENGVVQYFPSLRCRILARGGHFQKLFQKHHNSKIVIPVTFVYLFLKRSHLLSIKENRK